MIAIGFGLLAGGVVAIGWLIRLAHTAPYLDFDEHATTALAALTPDDTALPELDFAAEVLADIDDLPTTHEREYHR